MEEIVKKRVVAVVAVIVLLVGASVASIIYMKSGKATITHRMPQVLYQGKRAPRIPRPR